MDGAVDRRLEELGIVLPAPFGPVGEYDAAARAGDLLFVSGAGPVADSSPARSAPTSTSTRPVRPPA